MGQSDAASSGTPKQKMDFMRAMKSSTKNNRKSQES